MYAWKGGRKVISKARVGRRSESDRGCWFGGLTIYVLCCLFVFRLEDDGYERD